MSSHDSDRIQLHPTAARVRMCAGSVVIAHSWRAIRLEERGYPPRFYILREDVAMHRLRPSTTRTHCPFKGDADYFHLLVNGRTLTDAAWSYALPRARLSVIAGHLAFDHPQLTLQVTAD